MPTPLYPTLSKLVEDEWVRLDQNQITPWAFMTAGPLFRCQSFYGMEIAYQGIRFEGTPRDVFWGRYIEPFLEDIVQRVLAETLKLSAEKKQNAQRPLAEVSDLLRSLVQRAYSHMANIDQQLRGGGFPDSVSKRNMDSELISMENFIDERVKAEIVMLRPELLQESLISILFLSADPTNASRLRLGEELREIQEKLQLGKLRERFKLDQRMSVRPADISQALLDIQPEIIHFSGHGTATGELCFENQIGESHPVQPDALAALFEQFAHQVNCVILNACYSETQATAIAKYIEYVIGMNQAIGDNAAISFAIGFYQALGAGRSIEDAYKLGCVQIRLQGIPEHLTPVFYASKTQDNISSPAYIEHPSVEPLSQPAPVPQPQNAIDTVPLESEKGLDYRNLRDLLKAEKWREADEETLRVMLKAVNQENQGWLDNANLTQFPCKDLQTIDRLWVTASNGHFGFSVQKRIWEECGNPKEYNRNWIGFGVRVGWYTIMEDESPNWNNLINYPNLKFSTSISPVGELPRCFATFDKWRWMWREVGVLFYRARDCEL
jgi:GUN4-like/CHAT domain